MEEHAPMTPLRSCAPPWHGLVRRAALCALALVATGCATPPPAGAPGPVLPPPSLTAEGAAPVAAPTAVAPAAPAVAAPVAPATVSPVAATAEPAATPEPVLPPPVAVDPLRPDEPVVADAPAAQADLWARVRRGFAIPDLDTDLVRDRERWYATRPDYVQRMTERGSRYLFHIVEELERRNMPTELALLPFIESAFNPQAMSSARASGMWQFMPATGRGFDLKQNIFRDDRRDVLASTRAALDYLQKLHGMFGDWHLALAAYNWGEGSVGRAIARNRKLGLPTDYTSLSMPSETQYYVPKLQAVKNIVARPADFGLALPDVANHPYFLSVAIDRDMDVEMAARLSGMSVDAFKTLNPQMNKPVILAAGTPQVLLPFDNANRFVRNIVAHRGPLATWTAWVAPKTLRPAEAARIVGMNEAQLRAVNRIPPRMLVKAGSTLLVPRSERRTTDVSEHVADNATMLLAPDLPPMRKMALKAGRNDTVGSVARRYRVSAVQVAHWNGVVTSARFRPGQKIVVFVPAKAAKAGKATRTARGARPAATKVAAKAKPAAARVAAKPKAGSRSQVARNW
jgi:membrane-bound lytic murein transglycosylase D